MEALSDVGSIPTISTIDNQANPQIFFYAGGFVVTYWTGRKKIIKNRFLNVNFGFSNDKYVVP